MTKLDSLSETQRLPLRGCSDDKPPRRTDLLTALAVSLLSRPTELDSQLRHLLMEMVNQIPLCVPFETLQSHNGVCVRKITMQKIMSHKRRKKAVNMSK
jgi:hypothetical protein